MLCCPAGFDVTKEPWKRNDSRREADNMTYGIQQQFMC